MGFHDLPLVKVNQISAYFKNQLVQFRGGLKGNWAGYIV